MKSRMFGDAGMRTILAGLTGLCVVSSAQAGVPATQAKPPPATRPAILLPAAAAEQHGTLFATTRPAYTGAAYATGFNDEKDRLVWNARSETGGVYLAEIRYSAPGFKGYNLVVNGVGHQDHFEATGDVFATHTAGKVELAAGDNVVEVRKGWGHFDIDRVELIPTDLPALKKPPATLVNPKATPAALALMKTLVDDYGRTTRSGVISREDAQTVFDRTGVYPAIMSGDLMDFSPSRVARGAKSKDTPERLIEDYKSGYVVTVMWHWNAPDHLIDAVIEKNGKKIDAPWHRGFYTEATTFDVAAAMKDRDGADYKLIVSDIDAIAEQLKKLDAAGVPILWRPLHEADGGWFWWGAKGPEAFKALWSLMYDRLTNHHGLHNLIWVYTATPKWDWYPPAEEFDVIGVDFYPRIPRDPASAAWDALQARWGDRKLIALTEVGGVPDVAAAARLGVRWSYFASWGGKNGPGPIPAETLKRLYTAPTVANRPPQ